MNIKPVETPSSSSISTTIQTTANVANTNIRMETLMKEMKSLNDEMETKIQNFKKKCENQETVISSIKKCLQMDKLEKDFQKYKTDTAARIKSLEDSKSQLLNEKSALQRKYDVTSKSLTTETALRLSSSTAQRELQVKVNEFQKKLEAEKILRKTDVENAQKKIADLTKQLEAEKTLRKTVEDKVFSLESQIALNKVTPKDQTNGLTPVTPNQLSSVSDVKPFTVTKNQLNGNENKNKLVLPLSVPASSYSTRATIKRRKSMGIAE